MKQSQTDMIESIGFAQAELETIIAGISGMTTAGGTFTGDISVPDEVYGVAWNGSMEVPTKNALYDKIETIVAGSGVDTANSPNANEFARFTDADTIEGRTAAEAKADLDLEVGVDLQAWSANLDEYAAVNPTAAGLALLDDADNTAQRTTLGLGTLATQSGTFSGTHSGSSSGTNTGDQTSIVGISGTTAEFNTALSDANFATGGGTATGTNTGDQTSIVGITGTTAEFNTALSDANFATGGGTCSGTSSGTNTGDQTSIVGITGTTAEFNTALSDANFATGGGTCSGTCSGTNTGNQSSIVGISGTLAEFNTAISDANIIPEAGGTFTGDIIVPDEVYGGGWDGSLEVPTKNALYDKIQTMGGGGVDTANSPNANEFARFTDADTIEGRTAAEARADLDLEAGTDFVALSGGTFSGDISVPDEAYDATGWNGSVEVPTKNAIRDKIEDILDGVTFTGDVVVPDEAYDATAWNGSLEVPTKNAVRDKIETLSAGTVIYAPGHIWGLTTSRPSTSTITVAAGSARDEGDSENMVLAAPITKSLASGWAVGSGNGGLNTGAEASSTWYEVILIKRTDTGVVDVMFSTTANRATLPANYDKSRRIGWVRNDGSSNLLDFTQVDDHFTLVTPVNDVSTTSSATATSRTVTAPPSSRARLRVACLGNTNINAGNAVVFSELTETDTAPTTSNGFNSIGSGDFAVIGAGHIELQVNSSSQIRDRSITATGTMAYDISTFGWIDHRRRLSAT